MERSLIIIKPDGIQRGLIGEILHRFERKSLKVVGLKMIRFDEALLQEHYAHVADKPFFAEMAEFMSSSPVVVLVIEGYQAVEIVRTVSGVKAIDMGSIRGDFALSGQRNIVHSSDSPETAKKEIERFFKDEEIFEYEKDEWVHTLAEKEKNS
jgi:nucleoside-diphosphate kinase